MYHCRHEAIKAVLEKYEIPIKRRGLSKNRLAKEDYFDVIDTEEKAYFLGLMFTDGSIVLDKTKKRSPQISLSLKVLDINIIQKFREELNIESSIIYDKREGKESAILSFRSKQMAESLEEYGIIPRKTYLTKHLPKVPDIFLKDFLRGCLDGDGSIYKEKKSKKIRIDFCSYHKSVCEDFRNMCDTLLGEVNKNKIANYGSAFHIRYNTQAIVGQLATALYKDSKISITRKYSMASLFFENKSEEDIVYSDH